MIILSKRPGAQKSWVQDIGAVCGGNDDDARIGVEAVHFYEELS